MKKQLFALIFVIVVLSIISCSNIAKAADNGFDQICMIYNEVLNDTRNREMTIKDKLYLINEKVTKQVKFSDALQVYSAVASADPKEKYKLFKESAEYVLKREWNCSIMKSIRNP